GTATCPSLRSRRRWLPSWKRASSGRRAAPGVTGGPRAASSNQTHPRAGVATLSGDIVARRDERTMVKSQRALISQIGQIAHALAAEAGLRWRQVTFATVGSPGVFHPATGTVELAYALPGWGRTGLVESVQEELGTKIAVENDVNLAALGEQWRGLGKNVANFAYLHVGTGVGAGLVLNGELFRGHAG